MVFSLQSSGNRCPRCGGFSLEVDLHEGEVLCSSCGLVVKDKMEEIGPEWRSFQQNNERDDRRRVGPPISLAVHDKGLSTMIGEKNSDASGKALPLVTKAAIERLRTWDRRSQLRRSSDLNLRKAFYTLDKLADKLAACDVVVERAAYIYRKALAKGLTRGRPTPALVAAAVYAACRDTGTLRNLKDVSASSGVRKKDLAKCYRLLVKELDLRMPIVDPVKCVPRIASRAALSEKTVRRALDILKKAAEYRVIEGKDPMGLGAAALYMACNLEGEDRNQKDLAEAAGVTEVTIRNRCKSLHTAVQSSRSS